MDTETWSHLLENRVFSRQCLEPGKTKLTETDTNTHLNVVRGLDRSFHNAYRKQIYSPINEAAARLSHFLDGWRIFWIFWIFIYSIYLFFLSWLFSRGWEEAHSALHIADRLPLRSPALSAGLCDNWDSGWIPKTLFAAHTTLRRSSRRPSSPFSSYELIVSLPQVTRFHPLKSNDARELLRRWHIFQFHWVNIPAITILLPNSRTGTICHAIHPVDSIPSIPHKRLTYLHRIFKLAYAYLIGMTEQLSAPHSSYVMQGCAAMTGP